MKEFDIKTNHKKELSLEELSKKLVECQKERDEYLAGWKRARADFLNHKKEEIERIGSVLKYAGEELVLKLLPILDNFDLVEKKLPNELKKNDNIKGILQIKKQFLDFFKDQCIEEISCIGKKFDPNFQEAVEMVDGDAESETVIEEVQKGYMLNGKVIRPAKVKVIKNK